VLWWILTLWTARVGWPVRPSALKVIWNSEAPVTSAASCALPFERKGAPDSLEYLQLRRITYADLFPFIIIQLWTSLLATVTRPRHVTKQTRKNAWTILPYVRLNRYSTTLRFLDGGGLRGAGGRTYWEWLSGEGWVFICLELQCEEVNCTYGGEKTADQKWRCVSDSLLGYRLRIPPAKNRALHYTPVCGRWHGGTVLLHCDCTREFQRVQLGHVLMLHYLYPPRNSYQPDVEVLKHENRKIFVWKTSQSWDIYLFSYLQSVWKLVVIFIPRRNNQHGNFAASLIALITFRELSVC
jgi:hypothetical protein